MLRSQYVVKWAKNITMDLDILTEIARFSSTNCLTYHKFRPI